MALMRRGRTGVATLAVVLLAGGTATCDAERDCGSGKECEGAQSECRPSVNYCPGEDRAATLGPGQCRDRGAGCSSDNDCVPEEICDTSGPSGVCRAGSRCTQPPPGTPSCPSGCTWEAGFPCACVCQVCPAPDGGSSR